MKVLGSRSKVRIYNYLHGDLTILATQYKNRCLGQNLFSYSSCVARFSNNFYFPNLAGLEQTLDVNQLREKRSKLLKIRFDILYCSACETKATWIGCISRGFSESKMLTAQKMVLEALGEFLSMKTEGIMKM